MPQLPQKFPRRPQCPQANHASCHRSSTGHRRSPQASAASCHRSSAWHRRSPQASPSCRRSSAWRSKSPQHKSVKPSMPALELKFGYVTRESMAALFGPKCPANSVATAATSPAAPKAAATPAATIAPAQNQATAGIGIHPEAAATPATPKATAAAASHLRALQIRCNAELRQHLHCGLGPLKPSAAAPGPGSMEIHAVLLPEALCQPRAQILAGEHTERNMACSFGMSVKRVCDISSSWATC